MKITTSKLSEAQKVLASFAAAKVTGIEDFVNGLVDLSQQVISILQKRVSVSDNLDCFEKVFTVKFIGEVVTFLPPDPNKKVRHILQTRTSNVNIAVQHFTWQYIASGEIEIYISCTQSEPCDITFIMLY